MAGIASVHENLISDVVELSSQKTFQLECNYGGVHKKKPSWGRIMYNIF
jgi:hypothetical protein